MMLTITKYVTFDGKEHDTESKANEYLDLMFANLLESITHSLSKSDIDQLKDKEQTLIAFKTSDPFAKRLFMAQWIYENLDQFILLAEVVADKQLTELDDY